MSDSELHTYIIHTYVYTLYVSNMLFYRFLEACSLANLMQLNSTDVCVISVYSVCLKVM